MDGVPQVHLDEAIVLSALLKNQTYVGKIEFDEYFPNAKIKLHRTAIRSPNAVAFVERLVQTIKQECLDHFVVFGHMHTDVLYSEFKDHYHLERPRQRMDNETLIKPTTKGERTSKKAKTPDTIRLSDIRWKERLGGLLKRYSHAA